MGFPADSWGGVSVDERGGDASPDAGIGVKESLGRFEGRESTPNSSRIWSVVISVREVVKRRRQVKK